MGTDARHAEEYLIREALLREIKLYEARERLASLGMTSSTSSGGA